MIDSSTQNLTGKTLFNFPSDLVAAIVNCKHMLSISLHKYADRLKSYKKSELLYKYCK